MSLLSSDLLIQFIIISPALLVSMVFHEVAHGYVAYRLGDQTAKRQGRLSLNPIRHLEVFGTLVLFLTFFGSGGRMLFGWAKPVPINPRFFHSPQQGMMLVGAAGPFANFLLALISALALENLEITNHWLAVGLFRIFQLNIILMVFNLIPVPPLDGSRILGGFLPKKAYFRWMQLDQYGMLFIMLLLFLLMGPMSGVLYEVITTLYRIFLPSLVI